MWYVRDVLYAVLHVRVNCLVVRGCAISKRCIHICNSDVFSVVNMYHDHLNSMLCVGRRYVCCSEYYVVSNECDGSIYCLLQPMLFCNTVVKFRG